MSRKPLANAAVYYTSLAVVVTTLAATILGMFARPLGVPLVYTGDALSGGSQIKGTLENGWYERNPDLGAPFGQTLHDFPIADNLQFVLARFFGIFTDQWGAVYNLCYLATFPLAAVGAAWFIRSIGGTRLMSFTCAVLYAFTPYHFTHGMPHLALSMYFVAPLFARLLMNSMSGASLWPRRESGVWWNPIAWATPGTVASLVTLLLLGSTSSYYSVFGLLLMSVVIAVHLLRLEVRRAVGGLICVVVLIGVMVVNMAPDLLYARSVPASVLPFARPPYESELYALKFAALVFPTPWHPIAALAHFRQSYNDSFPSPGEYPALGFVGAAGFVFLLILPLIVTLARRSRAVSGFTAPLRHLALLTAAAFMFGTVGGLGTLFALLVSPTIRAWNRIDVYIAIFALAAVALLLDHVSDWLTKHTDEWFRNRPAGSRDRNGTNRASRSTRALVPALAFAVAAVGLWDEVPPVGSNPASQSALVDWRNDSTYVAEIEKRVPAGTEIFELPFMSFPEAPAVYDMANYDPMRPYLHSEDLRWSYAGVRGRPRSDWAEPVAALPVARMAVALAASGFGGIHIDRFGYPGHDPGDLETELKALAGRPIVSPNGRFAFYDLANLERQINRLYAPTEVARIKRHTVREPLFYWQPGFLGPPTPAGGGHDTLAGSTNHPSGVIDNPGSPVRMRLQFRIQAAGATRSSKARITWPDGRVTTATVPAGGKAVVGRTISMPTGQHMVTVSDPEATTVNLARWTLHDRALDFPLRGRAARVASVYEGAPEPAASP